MWQTSTVKLKPVATQSSFWLFLVSSVCGSGDCCHPVGLEGSLILTRRLTRYLMTIGFLTGGGMSSAMNWHTGFRAWITLPASCISASTIIGQMIVHPIVDDQNLIQSCLFTATNLKSPFQICLHSPSCMVYSIRISSSCDKVFWIRKWIA